MISWNLQTWMELEYIMQKQILFNSNKLEGAYLKNSNLDSKRVSSSVLV